MLAIRLPTVLPFGLSLKLYRAQKTLARWRRALGYATGRISADDASQARYDLQHAAGEYSLIELHVSDVIEEAGEIFEPNPELDQLCADAVRRVANKWDDYTEVRSSCHDWALDLVREYAKRDGIRLVEIED